MEMSALAQLINKLNIEIVKEREQEKTIITDAYRDVGMESIWDDDSLEIVETIFGV